MGHKTLIKEFSLKENENYFDENVLLHPVTYSLEEIIIEGKKNRIKTNSEIEISPELLKNLPSFTVCSKVKGLKSRSRSESESE